MCKQKKVQFTLKILQWQWLSHSETEGVTGDPETLGELVIVRNRIRCQGLRSHSSVCNVTDVAMLSAAADVLDVVRDRCIRVLYSGRGGSFDMGPPFAATVRSSYSGVLVGAGRLGSKFSPALSLSRILASARLRAGDRAAGPEVMRVSMSSLLPSFRKTFPGVYSVITKAARGAP